MSPILIAVSRPGQYGCILNLDTLHRTGGSLIVEARLAHPAPAFRLHWAGGSCGRARNQRHQRSCRTKAVNQQGRWYNGRKLPDPATAEDRKIFSATSDTSGPQGRLVCARGCQGEHHAAAREVNRIPAVPLNETVNGRGRWYETFASSALYAEFPAALADNPGCLTITISATLCLGTAVTRRAR
jgi:hypothetical protein